MALPKIAFEPMTTPPVPPPVARLHSYTTWQTDHPMQPLPGDWVDADLDNSNDIINLIEERLALIQRDDGGLVNGIVTADSLADDVLALVDQAVVNASNAAAAAAASAQAAASDAATSAAHAAQSALDAANAATAADAAFNYEQGAQAAQAAAEAAASAMPPPPLTPGRTIKVNGAGTAYIAADAIFDDGAGKWDAKGHVIKNGATAVAGTDIPTLTQVQGLISGSGSVPPPASGDVDKILTATGASAFNWLALTAARISDATAYAKGFLTGVNNIAQALAYFGAAAVGRLINTGTGLSGGGDLSADRTIRLADTAVAPGTYSYARVTVDQQGRLTAASTLTPAEVPTPTNPGDDGKVLGASGGLYSWTLFTTAMISDATAYMKGLLTTIANGPALLANIGGVPTSRTISAGTGLSGGGDLSANRTLSLANTAVAAGSYVAPNLTIDAQGRVTAAANSTAAFTDANNQFTKAQRVTRNAQNASTCAIDLAVSNFIKITMDANLVMPAPSNLVEGECGLFIIQQDGTGGRTLTWNAAYKLPGGTLTPNTLTANAEDVYPFYCDSGSKVLVGYPTLDIK